MRKFLIVCLAAALGLLTVGPIPAQETVPLPGTYVPEPSNRHYFGNIWVGGQLYRGTARTDWIQWFPAITYCKGDTTNLTPTRVAQYDWALARTATGAETINIICDLTLSSRMAENSGYKLTGFEIVYQNVGVPTSATWQGARFITYASGSNPTQSLVTVFTSTSAGIPSLSVVTHSQPITSIATVSAATFLNKTATMLEAEWQIVLNGSSIYRLYGIAARFSRAD